VPRTCRATLPSAVATNPVHGDLTVGVNSDAIALLTVIPVSVHGLVGRTLVAPDRHDTARRNCGRVAAVFSTAA